jgi:hypothetical protein
VDQRQNAPPGHTDPRPAIDLGPARDQPNAERDRTEPAGWCMALPRNAPFDWARGVHQRDVQGIQVRAATKEDPAYRVKQSRGTASAAGGPAHAGNQLAPCPPSSIPNPWLIRATYAPWMHAKLPTHQRRKSGVRARPGQRARLERQRGANLQ